MRGDDTRREIGASPPLEEFLGTESPIVVHDPQLEERGKRERAQLRSLPLLIELGLGRFLYDDLWSREFQLVEHEYVAPGAVNPASTSFPLGHIVTSKQLLPRHEQEFTYEDISQADVTWELCRRASREGIEGHYVLVCDTDSPQIPSRTPVAGRSVSDQFNAVTYDYEKLMHEYIREYVDSKLPLKYSKNLYLHRVSEYHARHDAPAKTIPELFEYDRAPVDSPIWRPLHFFIEHELRDILDEYEAHITDALRSWIEWGDTEKIARRMIATLHRCDFDRDELLDYQRDSNR